ncbi:MAG: polysaccharide deacetylase family protein [Eubacterium sp.]|nr:polysaccharide deacetylase family protein [Eubacterium sp.]MDD7210638.1 polysaccharide deacetylase family protein [Lachnospiraceae bacterium]MDY5498332.1 polysaccharide deacetylase family protein [Anaerobutyricum sp.]
MKIKYPIFFFLSLLICSLIFLSSCNKKSSEKKKSTENSIAEETTQTPSATISSREEEKAVSSIDPDTLPNEKKSWWIKRSEDHTIPGSQEEIVLSRYDAWYVKPNCNNGEKPVFLTFDCGYENGFTPSILDVLKKHHAPAAFFLCRHYIEDQPELVKRMKKEGHVVGNHTSHHICMPEKDSRTVREEISDNASYMKEATGYEMDHFFRPPKGEYSERTLQITKNMGYTTVFWSMAYLDYDVNNQPGSTYVIDHFEKYIHPGAIPLIHNISKSNAQALDTVLTNLEKEGYTFHSLYDLKKTP